MNGRYRDVEYDVGRLHRGVERFENARDAKGRRALAPRRGIYIENSRDRKPEPPVDRQMSVAHDTASADQDDRLRRRRPRPGLSEIGEQFWSGSPHRRSSSADATMARGGSDHVAHDQVPFRP